jgi:effector-binding domain-containing protein
MEQVCEVFETKEQPVLCIQKTTRVEDLPQLIGQSYGAIMQVMAERGVELAGEPYVAYFNMDMQNLQVELGFPVSAVAEGKGEVIAGVIPGGKKATTLYVGPYQKMAPAYETLTQFTKDQNLVPTGVAYEHYLNGPETPPEELKTRIVFPVK